MTWSDPVTRNTGDLITAAIWNQDVVDNGQFLHDRLGALWVDGVGGSNGDFATLAISASSSGRISFRIPDDFAALVEASLIFIPAFTGTSNLVFDTDYGDPGANELSTQHSETSTGNTQSVTSGKLYEEDFSAVLTALAAGDAVGLKVGNNSGAGNQVHVVGVFISYDRL